MSTVPATKVEIGFDLSALGGPFFILDDAVQGVLDNPTYTLGGTLFYDVSNKVLSVSVNRGKSRQLDKFTAGNSNITFINQDRAFDPLNASSPFFGQIIPRRTVRVTTSGSAVFYGSIDDWNLQYEVSGYSTAGAVVSDGFTYLAQQVLTAHTATSRRASPVSAAALLQVGLPARWLAGACVPLGMVGCDEPVFAADNRCVLAQCGTGPQLQ
jgi:hypothetical protein